MQALTAIQGMATIGITQINEATIKNFFFKRPYIHTTGAEIKECLKEVGIKLRPCKDYIPLDYMPLGKEEIIYSEIFKSREELYNLYIIKRKSPSVIANTKKCSTQEVYDNLVKFKIDLRTGHGYCLEREYKRKFKI